MAVATAPNVVPLSGFARAPFDALGDVFARIVAAQAKGGAALSIYHRGELTVDLVGGDYRPDSLQLLFSVTKAVTAIACAVAHDTGNVDLDAPLRDYWTAFDRPSTRNVTLRSVLAHRSGLAAFDTQLTLEQLLAGDDEQAVQRQEPYWEPDTGHGYHAFTFGTLVEGAFRRTLGTSVAEFVADHLARPLKLDLWIGAPASALDRLEPVLYEPPRLTPARASHLRTTRIPPSITTQLLAQGDIFNDPRVIQAPWPATTGTAGARDLARLMYATLQPVDDFRLLDKAALEAMIRPRSRGPDIVLGVATQFSSGMQLPFPQLPLLGPRSYGHEAAGGSAIFADPDHDVAVAFTTNVYPPMMGASTGFLALLPIISLCLQEGTQ